MYLQLKIGPKKSMWILDQARFGIGHGLQHLAGLPGTVLHMLQLFNVFSMSLSSDGHQQ